MKTLTFQVSRKMFILFQVCGRKRYHRTPRSLDIEVSYDDDHLNDMMTLIEMLDEYENSD